MQEYITKEGMQELQKKMQELIKERPSIIKQVAVAREMGDLSENAEYHAARERQRHLENEYNRLKRRAGVLKIVDSDKIAKDVVRFGARVIIEEIGSGKIFMYRFVGVDEVFDTNEDYERKSITSPLGRGMLGKKKGDVAIVKAPAGERKFKILEIK